MPADSKYFNFPVSLLKEFTRHHKPALHNILYYALYEHAQKLKLGSAEERFESATSYYNVSLGNFKHAFKTGRELYEASNGPKTGLNLSIYWDFHNNYKSDFEIVCLLGFLAIKSILGTKSYCKIDNRFWLARMDGLARSCDAEMLSPEIRKYANEYQTRKIKNELKHNWGLKTYSRYTRGFYVSFSMPLENLIIEAEKKRKSLKEKNCQQEEQRLVNQVLQKLYGEDYLVIKKKLNKGQITTE